MAAFSSFFVLLAAESAHSHPTWRDFTARTWIVVALAALAVAWVIWKAVLYSVEPGEEEPEHIKRMILAEPPLPEGLIPEGATPEGATPEIRHFLASLQGGAQAPVSDADAAGQSGA